MAAAKYYVWRQFKKDDGTYNVKILITHQRKTGFISTSYHVTHKQLNKKWEITDPFLRNQIETTLQLVRREIIKLEQRLHLFTARELTHYLKDKMNTGGVFNLNFIEHATRHANMLTQQGRIGTAKLFTTVANSLEQFLETDKLPIEHINVQFLQQYENWLRKPTKKRKALTPTGINLYMRNIRTLFNAARQLHNDEDRAIINIPHYPFSRYKIPQAAQSPKLALKPRQIAAIRDSQPTNKREILARDVFMLSFYLVGMNTVDLFNCTNIHDNRIYYNRQKVASRRSDNGQISIQLEEEAKQIMQRYQDPTEKRIFDFYIRYADRSTFNANINKGLKKIGQPLGIPNLRTYHARHSWATIARNICHVDKDDISFCLNHRTSKNVTDIYLEEDYTIIDRANRKVINTLLL